MTTPTPAVQPDSADTRDPLADVIAAAMVDALAPELYGALMESTADSWRQWRFLKPEARDRHRAHAGEMVSQGLAAHVAEQVREHLAPVGALADEWEALAAKHRRHAERNLAAHAADRHAATWLESAAADLRAVLAATLGGDGS